MNRFMTFIILSLFLTASTVARAGDTLPAFPGAEGFGAGYSSRRRLWHALATRSQPFREQRVSEREALAAGTGE
jgi:hypothetical protein